MFNNGRGSAPRPLSKETEKGVVILDDSLYYKAGTVADPCDNMCVVYSILAYGYGSRYYC